MTPKEIQAGIIARNFDTAQPRRKSVSQQVREARSATIDEAIALLRDEMRSVPREWHRGYNSAITKLELMK